MIKRFFEKSKNIDGITDKEVDDFLREQKVNGRVERSRVVDFYNMLSRVATGEKVEMNTSPDYDYFGCKNEDDVKKIDSLRDMEYDYLNHINKDILSNSRMLKAATFLSREFEKMFSGEKCIRPEDLNEHLRNLFEYEEEKKEEDVPATFGELMDMDFLFLRYLALLSKKKAFLKKTGKLVRSVQGNIHKYTPMEDFSEIYHMDLMQVVLPNFDTKMAQKDLYVRSRFEKVERGQNLIILIDDSGSMNEDCKRAMLKAALTLKIRDISDAHHVYIGTFEMRLFGFKKIDKGTTFEQLRSFIFLNKGTTDVNGCIMETISQIKARKLQDRAGGHYQLSEDSFEILVVNDGQDHVDETFHPAIKTHALCLKQTNNRLKNVCHRSGGTYFYMQADG